ncbi:hypothetical protein Tco_1346236 [Tanacetum coccineum]
MLDKQNDPILIEKKIKISPIDYSKLNKIKEDFGKCFVTKKELSAEQAFWLKHSSLSETPVTSHTPVRIEAPSELPKCSVDKNVSEIQIKQLRIDNDKLLNQIMSREIVHIVANSVDILDEKKSCVNNCNKCLELETELLKKKDFIEKEAYDKLVKAQSQEKNTVIRKLKDRNKSLSEQEGVENAKKDIDEIETINIELKHRVKLTTNARGSKPSGNTKNNRITRPPRSNQKNKVEDHSRKVKSSLNKTNSVSKHISNALFKHSMRNAKFESICAICNKCMFDANHDMCLIDFVNDVNWKPTGRFFTIVGNSCALTRITPKKIVHLKETTSKLVEVPKPEIKVYSRRPKQIKSVSSSKKAKIVESKIANNFEPTHLWGTITTRIIRFKNDQVAKITRYGDYQQGNVIISRVYYVEGLRHNLFSVGQFCDADLEVAFQKNSCFIQNLEGVDLLSGS